MHEFQNDSDSLNPVMSTLGGMIATCERASQRVHLEIRP
jgi:hypothetical protein